MTWEQLQLIYVFCAGVLAIVVLVLGIMILWVRK